jgi:glycolate oxidase iron-sulfur subunit
LQQELIADCVHCGFCLPTCPTYVLWHEEMDSPRGRIYLMGALVDGSLELGDTVVEHFDRCLGCMACVTACPSGVKYDRLIETTRAYVEERHRRGLGDRLVRALLFQVLPHRRRLRAALALRRLPAPGPLAPLKQIAPPWVASEWPPEHSQGPGSSVALVAGCVQSVVFGDVNAATARVLAADGYDVHVPRAQGCCGALHVHGGRLEEGLSRARELIAALDGYDLVVTNAAGCGSNLKDYVHLLADDPRWAERAAAFSARVRDVSELLADPLAQRADRKPLELRVAFQDSCHLRHAQRLTAEPRAALAQVPGLTLLEPSEQELCCGSAGIYNVVQPEAARSLGDRKARNVLAVEPDAYASGNPGCLVQVTASLRRSGRPLPAFHPIELVDASIRGLDQNRLLQEARR